MKPSLFRLFLSTSLAWFAHSSWAAPQIEHWTLPNGAQVYFSASTPDQPMVDVQVDFDAGTRRDPAPQAGLAEVVALMSTKGSAGTEPMNENALQLAWADLGATWRASAGRDRMSWSLRSLTQADLLASATLLASRQLAQPSFDDAIWAQEKARLIAAYQENQTRVGTVARDAFIRTLYGTHPYGFIPTPQSWNSIQTGDMRAFYAQHVVPCRAKVSIVGALNSAQAKGLAQQLLTGLPTTCPALPAVAAVAPLPQAQLQKIPFPAAQAHLFIGQPGVTLKDPAIWALTVGNQILGGNTLTSRLGVEIRDKRGLTYGVQTTFNPGFHAGAFSLTLQTRPDQAAQALALSQSILADFLQKGPTAQEVQEAKNHLIGSFALQLDSNRKLLDSLSTLAWYDLGLDYLERWRSRIEQVSAQDVRTAFARHLQPATMSVVVVGATP